MNSVDAMQADQAAQSPRSETTTTCETRLTPACTAALAVGGTSRLSGLPARAFNRLSRASGIVQFEILPASAGAALIANPNMES